MIRVIIAVLAITALLLICASIGGFAADMMNTSDSISVFLGALLFVANIALTALAISKLIRYALQPRNWE